MATKKKTKTNPSSGLPRPYFKDQWPTCRFGCFYPECTRIGDDQNGHRLLFCTRHGFQIVKMRCDLTVPVLLELPTEEWRKKERRRLQRMKRKQQERKCS